MSKVLERSSPGVTTPTSSASPADSKKHEKAVPRYLRASTGSCHDACKYGHKNPSEEVSMFSGGRRKKLPTQLNNLTLHRSAILDRPKDVRNRSLSLAKSSISLGEAEWVAPKVTANRKGVASNEHLVMQTATSADHKRLNSDSRKKHSMVAQQAPTNLRYSNGFPKFDQKATTPVKDATFGAKSRSPEKTLPGNSRNVDKVRTVKQSLLKRPASSPTKLNMIKQVPVLSQASSQHPLSRNNEQVPVSSQASSHILPRDKKQVPVSSQASRHYLLSKDKSTPKGKVTSPPAAITRVRAKPGRSPTRSSNASINGKEGLDMSRSSLSVEPNPTASVEVQEDDLHVTGYYVESTLAELSSDATECIDNSRPAREETSRSISEDAGVGSTEKSEVLGGETFQGVIALELQQSLDGQEFNCMLSESDPEHKLAEQNVMHGRASEDEDSQTDGPALFLLSERLTTVENTDVYDPVLTESNSKSEDNQVKVNVSVEALITEGKEEVQVHGDFERSPELVALDEKHTEEPESYLDFASGNAAENDKADEVFDGRVINCTSHCQSISETSSDAGLLEEPKSMLIEPSDSAVHELASVSNKNSFEHDELKSRIFIPQSPEELSDDEFYEEYDFELSESDESGTEDEEATINGSRDEALKADDQRPRRISALELDNASITPYKLKFKRGKIVELPTDSSGPRRLKFRRKAVNEVSNSESQLARRIPKKNNTNNTVPSNPDVESPGVKLRHQDTQEKKDAQGLFNNVIEETASKLVESRKSKVKALVGAFETVISLQDGKPTSSAQHVGNSQDSVQDDEGNAHEEAR